MIERGSWAATSGFAILWLSSVAVGCGGLILPIPSDGGMDAQQQTDAAFACPQGCKLVPGTCVADAGIGLPPFVEPRGCACLDKTTIDAGPNCFLNGPPGVICCH